MTLLLAVLLAAVADAGTDAAPPRAAVTQEDVDQAVRAQTEKIDACFVAMSPGAPKGGVNVRLVVGTSGYVAAVEIVKNTANPAVGACVLGVMTQVKLPEGDEEFAVEIPIAVGPTLPGPKKKK